MWIEAQLTLYNQHHTKLIKKLSQQEFNLIKKILNLDQVKPLYNLNQLKYFNIRDLAWKVLIENNVKSLPVDIKQIIKNYGFIILEYPEQKEIIKIIDKNNSMPKCEGLTIKIKDYRIICYTNITNEGRKNFTIAHELGHALLEHITQNEQNETEANMFAARILMPMCVLHDLKVKSPQEISQLCNVSFQAATYRYERLQMLKERKKFYTSKLERKVRKNFIPYILKQKVRKLLSPKTFKKP